MLKYIKIVNTITIGRRWLHKSIHELVTLFGSTTYARTSGAHTQIHLLTVYRLFYFSVDTPTGLACYTWTTCTCVQSVYWDSMGECFRIRRPRRASNSHSIACRKSRKCWIRFFYLLSTNTIQSHFLHTNTDGNAIQTNGQHPPGCVFVRPVCCSGTQQWAHTYWLHIQFSLAGNAIEAARMVSKRTLVTQLCIGMTSPQSDHIYRARTRPLQFAQIPHLQCKIVTRPNPTNSTAHMYSLVKCAQAYRFTPSYRSSCSSSSNSTRTLVCAMWYDESVMQRVWCACECMPK